MSTFLGEALDHFTAQGIVGPYQYRGTTATHFAAGSAQVVGIPGISLRLVSLVVNTASSATVVNLYEGTDRTGNLIASITCSKKRTIPFNVVLKQGLFISVNGGVADVTLVSEAAPPPSGTLTFTGDMVTDAVRTAAAAWGTGQNTGVMDGQTLPDSSVSMFDASTNLFRHGQVDATTDWTNVGSGQTTTIDATTAGPVCTTSLKTVCDGTISTQGIIASSATGQAAATGVNGIGSVWFKGTNGVSYKVRMQWTNTDATTTTGAATTFNGTGAYQLLTPAGVGVAAAKTGDKISIQVFTSTNTAGDNQWYQGAMLPTGVVELAPYVPTTGGATRTSTAPRITLPVKAPTNGRPFLTTNQGWVAFRLRMGFAATDNLHGVGNSPVLFRWGVDSTHLYTVQYQDDLTEWFFFRANGTSDGVTSAAQTFVVGQLTTVIAAWDAGNVYLSVDGGAPASVAGTNIPDLSAVTVMDIGSNQASLPIYSWLKGGAMGTGPLAASDYATINALMVAGNPQPSQLPPSALCTMTWPADSSRYYTP